MSRLWVSEHLVQGRFPALQVYTVDLGDGGTKMIRAGTRHVRLYAEDACTVNLGGTESLRLAADQTEWIEIDPGAGHLPISAVGDTEDDE